MSIVEFLNEIFFTIGDKDFTYLSIIWGSERLHFLGLVFVHQQKMLPRFFGDAPEQLIIKKRVKSIIRVVLLLLLLLGLLWLLDLNYILYETTQVTLKISSIIKGLLILQIARLLDWVFSRLLIYNYARSRAEEIEHVHSPRNVLNEKSISRIVKSALYVLAIILILQKFDDVVFHSFGSYDLRLSSFLSVLLVILMARLIAWIVTQLVLFNYFKKSEVDIGAQFAVNQLVKYIIYVLAFFVGAQAMGLEMTVMLGGLAALLVGVGLGLQQTFNDLFSGIILLFERSVEIGQMIEIDGLVGSVKQIGLRTSVIETRDNVTVIVPNSKLITDKVINWSHYDDKVRFVVSVGVAYGSDTALVKELLLKVAKDNVYVLEKPTSSVRFINFGDSSLDFQLHFWSRNFLVIEDIKSDLRFAIDKEFREKDIQIPFPQRDVWVKSRMSLFNFVGAVLKSLSLGA